MKNADVEATISSIEERKKKSSVQPLPTDNYYLVYYHPAIFLCSHSRFLPM